MISETEYLTYDALGLAALVRAKQVSAAELLEVAIAREAQLNPRLNAVVIPMHEIARERAKEPLHGPFAGVPFLLKDLEQDYDGVVSSSGNRALRRVANKATQHAEITRRWLDAGVVMFGRTNSPEFGAKGITEPDAWGPTRNPWLLERTPGGSSGGSAAAVAAGIVPMAGASDGGGSIRIPASYTGLFGLKPGRGRTPWGPERGEVMHGAAMNHVLSRSVRDSAAMLDATHGPDLSSWSHLAPPVRPYLEEVSRDPGKLRIGFSTRSVLGDVDAQVVAAVEQTARWLSSLGHHVERAEPAIDGAALARDFLGVWFAQMAHSVDELRQTVGATDADFELDTLAMAAIGKSRSGPEYVSCYVRWNQYVRALAEFHTQYDLYMLPSTAFEPSLIGEIKTPKALSSAVRAGFKLGLEKLIPLASSAIDKVSSANLRRVPFTQLANLTGTPAMSVPLHSFANGLPLGVQFVAPHGGEGRLFSLAGQLEQAHPWASRRAPC